MSSGVEVTEKVSTKSDDNILALLTWGHRQSPMYDLERRLAPSLPKVKGNVSQLEEVLLNLFTNAREAMTAGGRLRVESRLGADDRTVEILVADTGDGVPEMLVQ